jgi:hypothetical protein
MLRFAVVLALLISACGSADDATEGGDDNADTMRASDAPSQTRGAQHALLVPDASKLPACDEAAEGLLVYVKADGEFQACASGAWEAIDLKGKDGLNGSDGKDGAKGEDGTPGEDGLDSSSTVWLDPFTNRRWVAATAATWGLAQSVCDDTFAWPSCDDLIAAANHGIYNGLGSHTAAWCGDDYTATRGFFVPVDANPFLQDRLKSDVIGVYCVEVAE